MSVTVVYNLDLSAGFGNFIGKAISHTNKYP